MRKCLVLSILRSEGVDALAGAKIPPDAPTYSHLRCLSEKHGWIYLLTYNLKVVIQSWNFYSVRLCCVQELLTGDFCFEFAVTRETYSVHDANRVRGGGKRAFLATAIFLAMKKFRLARPATCLSNTNTTLHYVS